MEHQADSPRLVIISGLLAGRSFDLDRDVLTLGRHATNDIHLSEADISRHHGELRRENELYLFRDLGSRHGTFVNDLPVRERVLAHGDVIRIGRSTMIFLVERVAGADEPGGTPSGADTPSAAAETSVSTIQGRSNESLYLRPGEVRSVLSESGLVRLGRIANDLNALLEISTAIQQARSLDEMAGSLLDLLLPALKAKRSAFLLVEPGDEGPRTVALRGEDAENADWGSVFSQAYAEQSGVLAGGNHAAFLAAPLRDGEELVGALVFESRGEALTNADLELANAGSRIASLALANLRLIDGLRQENRRLRGDHGMVGESPEMHRLLDVLARVAPVESTVLLRGASGTGKELAARALHDQSPRADGPFVAVNCATLSETLLESELFGHEKGAFTGAVARKVGKVEAAAGGTLFLDEVGEIPMPLQAKLLRVLQEREFDRVGGTRPIRADIRLAAATHRDLEVAIREGTFREDLYYRLNVITVTLPDLRQRRGDIALLARHFASSHGRRLRQSEVGLTPATLRLLAAYEWPGNIRQLSNAIERAVVLGDGELIRPEDLPEEILDQSSRANGEAVEEVSDFQAAVIATKKKLLLQALEATNGNAAEAGRQLGLHPNSFRRLMRQLNLKAEKSR